MNVRFPSICSALEGARFLTCPNVAEPRAAQPNPSNATVFTFELLAMTEQGSAQGVGSILYTLKIDQKHRQSSWSWREHSVNLDRHQIVRHQLTKLRHYSRKVPLNGIAVDVCERFDRWESAAICTTKDRQICRRPWKIL
jgi:hypothetical protein